MSKTCRYVCHVGLFCLMKAWPNRQHPDPAMMRHHAYDRDGQTSWVKASFSFSTRSSVHILPGSVLLCCSASRTTFCPAAARPYWYTITANPNPNPNPTQPCWHTITEVQLHHAARDAMEHGTGKSPPAGCRKKLGKARSMLQFLWRPLLCVSFGPGHNRGLVRGAISVSPPARMASQHACKARAASCAALFSTPYNMSCPNALCPENMH